MCHCIGSWHTYPNLHVDTLEAAPGVVTLRAGCGAGCRLPALRALVHVLARPPVGGEAVARGAGAAEGAGLVVALALALVLETKVIRMFPKISQSRRRPLLGPSPG